MADEAPALTVVIPTYNRASLVPRAVRSILEGTDVAVEVIIVDDGSDDHTEAAVATIADPRVRYMRVPHGGVSAARNAGASNATGRWLAFLDSDDEVLPGWPSAMLRAVESSGGVAVCGGEALDATGGLLWTWTPPEITHPLAQQIAEMFLPGMFVVDRRMFADAGGYVEQLAFGENTELALRLLYIRRAPLAVVQRVLSRRHVTTLRETYRDSRIASARYVIREHPWVQNGIPPLWASYNALIGVHEARHRRWRRAAHHFLMAAKARPSKEHFARLALSFIPVVRSKVWSKHDSESLAVAIVCPGAGRVGRGYESFAIELARNLQGRSNLTAFLLAGGTVDEPWAVRIPTLPRSSRFVRLIASALRVPPVLLEQVSFACASVPVLWRLKPDTVLFSERVVGSVYAKARASGLGRLLGFSPWLILSNGGGSPPPYPQCDLVQHVTPVHYEAALRAGDPPDKHVCLPYGFDIPDHKADDEPTPPISETDRPSVISVGSLDSSRKRMNHVIREVARLDVRPYLILLGQESEETPALKQLSDDLLGPGNYEIATVAPDDVGSFYRRANVFVLASTEEAFGRVYIEAMMHGLPCIAHDFPVSRYVLGAEGTYVDMTVEGQLASALEQVLSNTDTSDSIRRRTAASRYSWASLISQYVALLRPPERDRARL